MAHNPQRNGRQGTSALIRQFLTAVSAIHNREIREDTAQAYESALSDVPEDQLRWALNETLRTVKFWPTPGHVRECLEQAKERQAKKSADEAWRAVRKRLDEWHYDPGADGGPWLPVMRSSHPGPDYTGRVEEYNGGYLCYPPKLPPATEYAVRHVGGWDRLRSLDDKAHDFVRRDFMGAVEHAETQGYLEPSEDEARGLLEQFPADLLEKALK